MPFRAEPFLGMLELVKHDSSERPVWALWEVGRYLALSVGCRRGRPCGRRLNGNSRLRGKGNYSLT